VDGVVDRAQCCGLMIKRSRQAERDRGLDERGVPIRRPLRQSVGPPEWWDLVAGLQFSLLFAVGLREHHRFLDIGCGSLRGGRLFIPYLAPGNYYGIEPFEHLVEEGLEQEIGRDQAERKQPNFVFADDFGFAAFGVEFDFMLAQSILSHTCADLAEVLLSNAAEALAPDGVLCATFFRRQPILGTHMQRRRGRDGSGWVESRGVSFTWREMEQLAGAAGLAVRRVPFPHPRQTWFVAMHREESAQLAGLARSLRGWKMMAREIRAGDPLRNRNPRAARILARIRSVQRRVRSTRGNA
jgi:SAM-dependent methyltransferase